MSTADQTSTVVFFRGDLILNAILDKLDNYVMACPL